MIKNIVVLSDGTGQEGGKGHDTNVFKLLRMLTRSTDRQVVFYDEGLVTDWRKVTGNAFGAGFSHNLLRCYKFIFENYNAGDKIYLFGFGRGAATVRSLASFIHYFGILPRYRPELIKKAYNLYRQGQDEVGSAIFNQGYKVYKMGLDRDEWEDVLNINAKAFVDQHPNEWVDIEFLGVWDTVPAIGFVALAGLNTFLGNILKYNFHDFRLHPSVKNAYHALAIDDDRLWFHPSLWAEKTREEQIVEQVWFNGAHTDVGGGFTEPGLSDITLEWMVEKAVSHGLRIYLGSRKYWNFVVAPDPTDLYHPARKGFGKVFKEGKRNDVWKNQGAWAAFGRPIIHRSVLERHKRSKNINASKRYSHSGYLETSNVPQERGGKNQVQQDVHSLVNVWNKTKECLLRSADFWNETKSGLQQIVREESLKEDDENPWILDQVSKSSNFFRAKDFKDFLSQKFYETIKNEWKKYDWEKDKYQDKKFDEWVKESKYKEYYGSYEWDFHKTYLENGYKKYALHRWADKIIPETRLEWMKNNPYSNDKGLDPEWLESYQPYKDWLKEHTEKHENQVYYVEPFRLVEGLRDYDEESLEEILNGDDPNPNNMQNRGGYRIQYDRNRWEGSDRFYNENFLTKRSKSKQEK